MSQLETEETRRKQWEWLLKLSAWLNTPEGRDFAKQYTEEPDFDFRIGDKVYISAISDKSTERSGVQLGDSYNIVDVDLLDECALLDRLEGTLVVMEDLKLVEPREGQV